VFADQRCNWRAVSEATWLTLTSGRGNAGNGTISYMVDSNPDETPRSATIRVGDKTFTINQAASSGGGAAGGDGGGDGGGAGSSGGSSGASAG
jgi:hypothetical protein